MYSAGEPGRLGAQQGTSPLRPPATFIPLTPGTAVLDGAGWGIPRAGELGMELPPLGCPELARPPSPQLCLRRVAEVVWTAGWAWSTPPAEFLFHGITAGWDGGAGAPSEAGSVTPWPSLLCPSCPRAAGGRVVPGLAEVSRPGPGPRPPPQ